MKQEQNKILTDYLPFGKNCIALGGNGIQYIYKHGIKKELAEKEYTNMEIFSMKKTGDILEKYYCYLDEEEDEQTTLERRNRFIKNGKIIPAKN